MSVTALATVNVFLRQGGAEAALPPGHIIRRRNGRMLLGCRGAHVLIAKTAPWVRASLALAGITYAHVLMAKTAFCVLAASGLAGITYAHVLMAKTALWVRPSLALPFSSEKYLSMSP